jgi:hypothetical protein
MRISHFTPLFVALTTLTACSGGDSGTTNPPTQQQAAVVTTVAVSLPATSVEVGHARAIVQSV